MIITSPNNPRVKHIRKLHERKYRESYSQFFIEGLRIVAQAIEEGIEIEYLVVSDELLVSDFGASLVDQQKQGGTPILHVSGDIFKRISQKDGPQGLALVGKQSWHNLMQTAPLENELWLALDRIQDPGNLGTIIRTADAVGCSGLILLGNCTDPYDPAALRASMGAVFTVKIVKSPLEDFTLWRARYEIPVLGTSDQANTYYRSWSYPQRLVILMGSEREGLHGDLQGLCDEIVGIPMAGKSDSLNLAVATGVILYEYYEQNRKSSLKGEKR